MTAKASSHGPVHPWVAEGQHRILFGIAFGARQEGPEALVNFVGTLEALGFDSFWGIDHPLLWGPDRWTTLATLAAMTRTIRLGSLVSCVYYRSPALLARMAADIDRWSEGRLVLGLRIGDAPPEFARLRLPLPPPRVRLAALDDTIQIVTGLWSGTPFTYDGPQFGVTESPSGRVRSSSRMCRCSSVAAVSGEP